MNQCELFLNSDSLIVSVPHLFFFFFAYHFRTASGGGRGGRKRSKISQTSALLEYKNSLVFRFLHRHKAPIYPTIVKHASMYVATVSLFTWTSMTEENDCIPSQYKIVAEERKEIRK